jgi:hypothetical protein
MTRGRHTNLPVYGVCQPRLGLQTPRKPRPGPDRNGGPYTWLWLLLPALLLVGCKSVLVSSYISPRVTGRVLAADTRQPIPDVKIRRFDPQASQDYDSPARGGRKMEPIPGAKTDAQGKFVLDAERDLTLVQQQVWYSVSILFERVGYRTLRTNFTVSNVTSNAPDGAPVVTAGDILLHPASP